MKKSYQIVMKEKKGEAMQLAMNMSKQIIDLRCEWIEKGRKLDRLERLQRALFNFDKDERAFFNFDKDKTDETPKSFIQF